MTDEPQNIPEQKIEQVQNPQAQESAPPIKTEENLANWRAFREKRESERKAHEEAEKRAIEKAKEAADLKAALEAAISNKQSQSQTYQEEETEEARIDKRVREIIAEREKAYQKEHEERERQEFPNKLKSVYNDFDKVCNAENIDYLEYHYPEIAVAFKYMPDGFDKWSSIYKAVKKFVPNTDARGDSLKAEKNLNKPGSISSSGNAQGPSAMPSSRLDDAKKEANWQRMQRTLKGLSN